MLLKGDKKHADITIIITSDGDVVLREAGNTDYIPIYLCLDQAKKLVSYLKEKEIA